MSAPVVGFVGFGEVGPILSEAIRRNGAEVLVFDILLQQEGGEEVIRNRSRAPGIQFASLGQVVESSDYVLSPVTTQVAKGVTRSCAPYLRSGQIYFDLNSTSPAGKMAIDEIIAPSGADFVEGAILGAVGASGSRTRILTARDRGREAAETFSGLGLNVTYYSPDVGKASMFKMLRSILSKGLEALILEFCIAGKRAGLERDLWDDIMQFMAQNTFEAAASNWVCSHAVAYERRYHEIVQVVETMRELGLEPLMTAGTQAFFERSLALRLKDTFGEKPDSVDSVVAFFEKRLRA